MSPRFGLLSVARLSSVVRLLIVFTLISVIFTACATKIPEKEEPQTTVPSEPPPESPPEILPEIPLRPLIDMVSVSGGSFNMGSPRGSGQENERPSHQVTLPTFSMGKYEVTQGQYFEVTGQQPANFRISKDNDSPDGWKNLPVEKVSWYGALVFCNRLSIKEKLTPVYRINGSTNPNDWGQVPTANRSQWNFAEIITGANGYRLPTEAEWEYAAKGGSLSRNFSHAGSNNPNDVSWYYDNSEFRTREVGKKVPNELGLYDMSGNVMEWCWDWYESYTSESQYNPAGPSQPSSIREPNKVIRGGGFSGSFQLGRVAYRSFNIPSYNGVNTGFRVARSE
jgi:formylglycine-generating enzyme required for sulfatase activity